MRFVFYIPAFCLLSIIALGQDTTRHNVPFSIAPVIEYGRIWKHTIKFKPAIETPSETIELDLQKQTIGDKYWQHFYKYPQYGIALSVIRFGNDSVLGYGFGFLPYLQLPIITRSHFQLTFRAGSGIAYLTKRYDVITNPDNDVIASHINDITSFSLRLRAYLSVRSALILGASFTHYSAGATRIPNLGINIPTFLNLGYSYTFNPSPINTDLPLKKEERQKQIILRNKIVLARFEALQANGPFYSQYGTEMAVGKYLAPWNKLFINGEFFYNTFIYYYLLNQEIQPGHEAEYSIGSSISVDDEFMFNHVGLTTAVAYVLYQPYFKGADYYEKLGIQYHFFKWGMKKKRNLFVGVYLKTHWAEAEHVETALGLEW